MIIVRTVRSIYFQSTFKNIISKRFIGNNVINLKLKLPFNKQIHTKSDILKFEDREEILKRDKIGWVEPENDELAKKCLIIAGVICGLLILKSWRKGFFSQYRQFLMTSSLVTLAVVTIPLFAMYKKIMMRGSLKNFLFVAILGVYSYIRNHITSPHDSNALLEYCVDNKLIYLALFTTFSTYCLFYILGGRSFINAYGLSTILISLNNFVAFSICKTSTDYLFYISTVIPLTFYAAFLKYCRYYPMSTYSLKFLALLVACIGNFHRVLYFNYWHVKASESFDNVHLSSIFMVSHDTTTYYIISIPFNIYLSFLHLLPRKVPGEAYQFIRRDQYSELLHVPIQEDYSRLLFAYRKYVKIEK